MTACACAGGSVVSASSDQRAAVSPPASTSPASASCCARRSASADAAATSGCTPLPSQLPLVIGLTGEPVDTNTLKPSSSGNGRPGLAAPPLASPTTVARLAFFSV